ncbi:MAG: RecX family transcriptional regulator [Flavobacteriales bacterium]|jgi:regulatory protein|nr:RecX family transcriptional regulator [Flavobacteriales bacterium]
MAKKIYDLAEAKQKIEQYCVYQDRCFLEVEQKLRGFGLMPETIDHLVDHLMEHDFINEERFARSYVRGAFRYKKWGRKKIQIGLKQKNITAKLQEMALQEIDQEEYLSILANLLEKKSLIIKYKNDYDKKQKLIRYALQKGYLYEEIQNFMD